jgi:glycosyltransferase involved in cell wall biosynthesis
MNTKFSITVPAYKSQYLEECMDSVLSQTYSNFELIILNDASPENLDEIISKYHDERIRYYKNEKNVGAENVVDNWNKCLNLAEGEYIICMGDDDKLAPNCLEEYNILIYKYPDLNVYHARTLMIDENSAFCDLQEDRPDYESVYSMIWHRTFKERIQFIGDFLYRTSVLRENGGFYKFPLAWESDCVTSFLAAKDRGIANLHKPTFYYRRSRLTITSSSNVRLKMEATKQYEVWLDKFLKLTPENEMDKRYHTLILKGVKEKIIHNEIFMIANDLSSHYVNGFFYWMKKRSYYGLSFSHFIMSCIIGLGLKFKG